MKIIVGLGNPGKQYEHTRHNAGFDFVDLLIQSEMIASVGEEIKFKKESKFEAEIAETMINGEKLILVKPQTFMNNSGKAVNLVASFYKAIPDDLIVIADDIDLPVGMVRIRCEGTSGGHKGLQSIIDSAGTDKFVRIRIGVNSLDESRRNYQTTDFVLGKPSEREKGLLSESISTASNFLLEYLGKKEQIPAHTLQIKVDSL